MKVVVEQPACSKRQGKIWTMKKKERNKKGYCTKKLVEEWDGSSQRKRAAWDEYIKKWQTTVQQVPAPTHGREGSGLCSVRRASNDSSRPRLGTCWRSQWRYGSQVSFLQDFGLCSQRCIMALAPGVCGFTCRRQKMGLSWDAQRVHPQPPYENSPPLSERPGAAL